MGGWPRLSHPSRLTDACPTHRGALDEPPAAFLGRAFTGCRPQKRDGGFMLEQRETKLNEALDGGDSCAHAVGLERGVVSRAPRAASTEGRRLPARKSGLPLRESANPRGKRR